MIESSMRENVTIKGQYDLSGTLLIPSIYQEKFPAVVLVAGSGEVDRNGNAVKLKFNMNIYKELAQTITELGFITLRYDKRGVGESKGNFMETGMWDLVDDLVASVELLRNHPKVDADNIILLGHSEGCTLITAAYTKCNPSKMIMLSGAAEPIIDALKRQRDIAFSEVMNSKGLNGWLCRLLKIDQKGEKQASKLIEKIKASNKAVMKYNLVKINAKWQREHFNYNIYEDLMKINCPILAITGDKDFQANPERLKSLPELVNGDTQCHVVENMDHILKEFKGQISAMKFKKQYQSEADQPLHQNLVELIKKWLLE